MYTTKSNFGVKNFDIVLLFVNQDEEAYKGYIYIEYIMCDIQ